MALPWQQVNEMKVNKKHQVDNLSSDDGRVGWKYPLNSKEIVKACEKFFEKRGMKKPTFMPTLEKK
jgi:phage-related protein